MSLKPSQINIRQYVSDDYPSVKAILEGNQMFYEPFDNAKSLSLKITQDPDSILVAAVKDEVVGTVSFMEDGRMAFIFRLAVKPESKNAGIGSLLMHEAEQDLFDRGYKTIHILVESENQRLIDYYGKKGYESGNNYLWMSKER